MDYKKILNTIDQWEEATNIVLSMEDLSLHKMQLILKDTYSILTDFHKSEFVPRAVCELFLQMEEFLYFTSLIERNEKSVDFYHLQVFFSIIKSLRKGFFKGKYECSFPKLKFTDAFGNEFSLDLESDNIEDIFANIKH